MLRRYSKTGYSGTFEHFRDIETSNHVTGWLYSLCIFHSSGKYASQNRKYFHNLRFSPEEEKIIRERIGKYNYTRVSDFIRDAVLDKLAKGSLSSLQFANGLSEGISGKEGLSFIVSIWGRQYNSTYVTKVNLWQFVSLETKL